MFKTLGMFLSLSWSLLKAFSEDRSTSVSSFFHAENSGFQDTADNTIRISHNYLCVLSSVNAQHINNVITKKQFKLVFLFLSWLYPWDTSQKDCNNQITLL